MFWFDYDVSQFAILRNKSTVMECKDSSHVSSFSEFC